MKKHICKLFIILIVFISLFAFNVNAVTIKPYDYIIFGTKDLPIQNWIRTNNTQRVSQTIFTLNTTNITTSLPSDVQLFTEVYACVVHDGDGDLGNSTYISNVDQDGGFKNGNVNSVNLNVSCKVPDGYPGTMYKFYFQIYSWEVPSGGADFLRVSSYWNFNNLTMKTLNITITNIYITDTDNYLDDATLASQGKGQQVIINQNETIINNTDTIISKTDEIKGTITSDDSDVTSSKCGIICKLKGIFTGIIELPSKILNLLKSLFIPDNFDFVNEFAETLENKLGFIAQVPISFITFLKDLATATWEEVTSITLPEIEVFGYKFWTSQEIDITLIMSKLSPYRYVTDIACVCICIVALKRHYDNFGGKS